MSDFSRFASDLRRVASNLEPMRDRRVQRVAKGAADTARSVAPVLTGALKRDIRVVRRDDGSVAVETDEFYARFQEYGTTKMAPNPFIGPAVDKWGPRLVDELGGMADEIARDL